MGTRLNAVRKACRLDPDSRSEDHVTDIVEFVKDVKFFTKLAPPQQRALCRTMTIEEFGPREFIFQKDDVGDKFFIILTGSVGVQMPSTNHCPNGIHAEQCDCPNRPFETVVFLEKGMGFGELALQSDQPRSASIQTSEKTETLVTKRTDYENYAGLPHRQFIEQRVQFLRQFPCIEDALQNCLVSTNDIAAMANCLNESSLSGNEMAVHQGDVVDHMIFVRKGQLAMLRLVELQPLPELGSPGVGLSTASSTFSAGGRPATGGIVSQRFASPRARREGVRPATNDGRGAGAVVRGTPGAAGGGRERAPPPQSAPAGAGTEEWQSASMLSANLAKAMMELKRRERQTKLEKLMSTEKAEVITRRPKARSLAAPLPAEEASPLSRSHSPVTPRFASKVSTSPMPPVAAAGFSSPTAAGAGGAGPPADGDQNSKGKAVWSKLRGAMQEAKLLKQSVAAMGFTVLPKGKEETGEEAAQRNVAQFAAVSAARQKVTGCRFKQLAKDRKQDRTARREDSPRRKTRPRGVFDAGSGDERPRTDSPTTAIGLGPDSPGDGGSAAAVSGGVSLGTSTVSSHGRRRLLRIGTVGAFQYFGDRQICNGEVHPVSLVSDPVAEIYMMSKHDILRRLPKKLFTALFTPDKQTVPSDHQLLAMHRQTERWGAFKRSMHLEAMNRRYEVSGALRGTLRRSSATSRVDVAANLEFLGVNPQNVFEYLRPLEKKAVALALKDEELFSQSSAGFLRKLNVMKRDPRLQSALAKAGLAKHRRMGVGEQADEEDDQDPNLFRFEQHWSKLGKFCVGPDLDDGPPDEAPASCSRPSIATIFDAQGSQASTHFTFTGRGGTGSSGLRRISTNTSVERAARSSTVKRPTAGARLSQGQSAALRRESGEAAVTSTLGRESTTSTATRASSQGGNRGSVPCAHAQAKGSVSSSLSQGSSQRPSTGPTSTNCATEEFPGVIAAGPMAPPPQSAPAEAPQEALAPTPPAEPPPAEALRQRRRTVVFSE